MRRFVLGKVTPTSSLAEALARIHPKTRAIVVDDGYGSRVITAGDIFEAINNALDAQKKPEDVQVSEVVPTMLRAALAAPAAVATDRFGPPGSEAPLNSTEQGYFGTVLMIDPGHPLQTERYLVEEVGPDSATIVTSSEGLGKSLTMQMTVCICEGDPKHSFEPDQIRTPGFCNKPHGKRVTCGPVRSP